PRRRTGSRARREGLRRSPRPSWSPSVGRRCAAASILIGDHRRGRATDSSEPRSGNEASAPRLRPLPGPAPLSLPARFRRRLGSPSPGEGPVQPSLRQGVPMSAPHGIVVLDKPAGITSRDAVDTACKVLKTREIGHFGTLDPLAKGVLVLVVGRARRLQELLARSRKVYVARIRLGANSETDDAEGPITPVEPLPPPPSHDALVQALAPFRGEIDQRPPRYSAVKVDGERLYDLARRGQGIDAPMRRVKIYEIELTKYAWPDVELRVACAGGTY